MKTIHKIFGLILTSIVIIACSTEDPAELDPSLHDGSEEVDPPVIAGDFFANVDGAEFVEYSLTAIADTDGTNETISIVAAKEIATGSGTFESLALRFPKNITPGNYLLDNASTNYTGFYNLSATQTSNATTESNFQAMLDDELWIADNAQIDILGGVTTIKGVKGFDGESVNISLKTDIAGAYTFGPIVETPTLINTANYTEAGILPPVYDTDITETNGNISITIDTENKLMSGTFNFDGFRFFTPTGVTPTGTDTDGDGVIDDVEIANGTSETDSCDPIQPTGYTGYDATNPTWLAADCDGDGVLNSDELVASTDPYDGNDDSDGDGVSDAQEVIDGTDSANPCDPAQSEGYTGYDSGDSTWSGADCDGDTINNGEEVTNGTDPYFVEFIKKSFTSGTFTNVTYNDGGTPVLRGLRIISHDTAAKNIVGTFSFISSSIGEDPIRSYVITEGTFDVTYTE